SLSARFSLSFTATAAAQIYTLSLHDALPISALGADPQNGETWEWQVRTWGVNATASPYSASATFTMSEAPSVTIEFPVAGVPLRSEEHTSELQSRENLVCRLLLEKKKKSTNA